MTRDEQIAALKKRLLAFPAQGELPLEIYPDRVMIRPLGDRDVQELVQEMREDMEGITEYETVETLGRTNVYKLPKPNAVLAWGRVTRADDTIYLEGWWARPLHEAPFDPERGER